MCFSKCGHVDRKKYLIARQGYTVANKSDGEAHSFTGGLDTMYRPLDTKYRLVASTSLQHEYNVAISGGQTVRYGYNVAIY